MAISCRMTVGMLVAALGAAPLAHVAGEPPRAADEPYPLAVSVGQVVTICDTGTIVCPAGAALCDDPNVAAPVLTDEGLAFLGVGPGTTVCSAGGTAGQGGRAVYRVTVRGVPPPKGAR